MADVMVGEAGPEFVTLPAGSVVHPAAAYRQEPRLLHYDEFEDGDDG